MSRQWWHQYGLLCGKHTVCHQSLIEVSFSSKIYSHTHMGLQVMVYRKHIEVIHLEK